MVGQKTSKSAKIFPLKNLGYTVCGLLMVGAKFAEVDEMMWC